MSEMPMQALLSFIQLGSVAAATPRRFSSYLAIDYARYAAFRLGDLLNSALPRR